MDPEFVTNILNIFKIIFIVVAGVYIFVLISVIINKIVKKDLSDQRGFWNFREYAVGFAIMAVILLIIGFAIFVGFG